nr:immunoglobulin light chain junction region [Macaca mulatta]MOW30257.1 immunoglobulin light chain junction region [Macaca mulatta]
DYYCQSSDISLSAVF